MCVCVCMYVCGWVDVGVCGCVWVWVCVAVCGWVGGGVWGCFCVFYRPRDYGLCTNYEMVELQPQTVTPTDLGFVANY